MARAGRLFVPLDCGYFDDDRVVELTDCAQLLDLRALCLMRRLLADGRLTRRQLERIAPIGGDVGAMIGDLVASGLWTEHDGVFVRSSWSTWNDSAADIASMSKGGVEGNHLRWHVKRGVVNRDCALCGSGDIGGESGGDMAPDRGPNPRADQSRPEQSRGEGEPPERADHLSSRCRPVARSRLPEEFSITDDMRAWSAQQPHLEGVDIASETESFLNYYRSNGAEKADWSAAWRSWMGRAREFGACRLPEENRWPGGELEPFDPTSGEVLLQRREQWASDHPGDPVPLASAFRVGAAYGPPLTNVQEAVA